MNTPNTTGKQLLSFLRWCLVCMGPVAWLPLSCSGAPDAPVAPKGPNILLLVADDLGYADLGCYGGDIDTPNLDALAASGIRFTRFHTAPMCAPTRAMLLSGQYNHIAGMGRQNLQAPVFGYEGRLTGRVIPLPALLRQAGYHTWMAGKWHLGNAPGEGPQDKGFEKSFVLLEGVGNHYNGQGIFANGASHYEEDGKPVAWPAGRYSTNVYTDKLIGYMDGQAADGRPFFAYAAFTAPHWPLQVAPTHWKKYEGRYNDGYEALRAQRLQSLKEAGMIPAGAALPPAHPSVRPWASLSPEEQQVEARKMELYAGMVDNLDANIGRLLDHLKATGQYEHTLIIFMSDNGAAGEDYFNEASIRPHISPHYDNRYENMGTASSMVSYGAAWAEAGTAPFRYFKEFTTNGGIIAPMILAGAMVERKNTLCPDLVTVMDLAPTLYDAAGVHYPERWETHPVYPMKGRSFLSYARGKQSLAHPPDYAFGLEHTGYTMFRKGDWKITTGLPPFEGENFELYDLSRDLAEQHDLREKQPAKFRELLEEWRQYARENQLQFPR